MCLKFNSALTFYCEAPLSRNFKTLSTDRLPLSLLRFPLPYESFPPRDNGMSSLVIHLPYGARLVLIAYFRPLPIIYSDIDRVEPTQTHSQPRRAVFVN